MRITLTGGPEDGLDLDISKHVCGIVTLTALNEVAYYRRQGSRYLFSHIRRGTEYVG